MAEIREGYRDDFLGAAHKIGLPEAGLALQSDVLQPPELPDGEVVVPYINYSLLMSVSTKQALYSAANVDNGKLKKVPSRKGRNWFVDSRVGADNQIANYPYQGSQWDRGHLTRRTAVTWGDNVNFATKASNDSCAYTNACMQHKNFNEDEWRAVEVLVSDFDGATKLTVITGPIFTRSDRYFTREFEDYPVRIPSGFWKIVSYVDKNNKLRTQAYVFFQDLPTIRSSKGRSRLRLKDMQVTTTEVAQWTGLEFEQVLFDSNPLKFYSGPESISVKKRRELLEKDPDTVVLEVGIPTGPAAAKARDEFPLEDFYELIAEVSWV